MYKDKTGDSILCPRRARAYCHWCWRGQSMLSPVLAWGRCGRPFHSAEFHYTAHHATVAFGILSAGNTRNCRGFYFVAVAPRSIRTLSPGGFGSSVIALAGAIALLYYGRVFLVTLATAVIIAFILEPFVGLLMRLRMPR